MLWIPNPNWKPLAPCKALSGFIGHGLLFTFKINMNSKNMVQVFSPYPKDNQNYKPHIRNSGIDQHSNQDFVDIDILCTFKLNLANQALEHNCEREH